MNLENDDDEKTKLLANYLINKYRESSDDSGLKAAQEQQSSAKNISLIGEALSGFATAQGRARGYESDNSFWNKLGSRYDGNVEAARQGIADKQKQFFTELNLENEQDEYDPNSQVSQGYRDLAQRMMPNGKFEGVPASKIKRLIPAIEGVYKIDSAKQSAIDEQARRQRERQAEAERREFEYNRNKQDELAKENRAEARKIETEKRTQSLPDNQFKLLPKDKQITIEDTAKANVKKSSIKGQIEGMIKEFDSAPNEDEKIRIGRGMLKILNSTEGADAIGVEESKRLGDALEYQILNLTGPGPMFGRDLEGFKKQVNHIQKGIGRSIETNQKNIDQAYGRESAGPTFPMTVINRKTGKKVEIINQAELSEAMSEGYSPEGE